MVSGHVRRWQALVTLPFADSTSFEGTAQIAVYSFTYNKHTVHLIDTPGFNDTTLSDTDVLKAIAQCFHETYSEEIKLSGVIYLHKITDNRMTGNAVKNLGVFRKICGDESLKGVVLATTMWDSVSSQVGNSREEELETDPFFWGSMKELGSDVERLIGETGSQARHTSAMNVVKKIVNKKKKIVLDIQKQMVDEHMDLPDTSAGKELGKGLIEEKQKHERELKLIQEQMDMADEKTRRLLADHEKAYQDKLDKLDKDKEALNVSIADMYKQKEAQIKEINDLRNEQIKQAKHLEKTYDERKKHLEKQFASQKQDIEKERTELRASTKAQKNQMAEQDARMEKKLQGLEIQHARELQKLRDEAEARKAEQSPLPPSSSGSALPSYIIPLSMIAVLSLMTGGIPTIPGVTS